MKLLTILHVCSLMTQNQQDYETILEFKTATKLTMGNKTMLLVELIFVLLLLLFVWFLGGFRLFCIFGFLLCIWTSNMQSFHEIFKSTLDNGNEF